MGQFWGGRSVIVTGGNGFLGRHVTSRLADEKADVISPRSSAYDLTSFMECESLFQWARPQAVIHLAARVGGIGANKERPGEFFYANAAMGLNVIECCRKYKVENLVLVGTVCAYPKFTPIPFKESDLWNGYPEETNAPYGVAKKALMVMAEAYYHQYGLKTTCLLPVNLYGPYDNFDHATSHVIPAMIRKFSEAKDKNEGHVTLWGSGTPTREFLYVDDCAEAIVKAPSVYSLPDPINLGSSFEISIKDLAEKIKRLIGYEGLIEWDLTKPDGQPCRKLDVTKAKKLLNWESTIGFDLGLRLSIEWYRDAKALGMLS